MLLDRERPSEWRAAGTGGTLAVGQELLSGDVEAEMDALG